jgi:hypothetical protein
MKFSIDLVYIDRNRRVRKVRDNVAPWRISLCLSAHSILELPAGTIAGTHTRGGDVLELLEYPERDPQAQTPALPELQNAEPVR